jgi:chromosome segregation ATPase
MSIILQGKKRLLRPGDVIESDRELREVFLERVADDTPVTNTGDYQTREVDKLAAKVADLEASKESLAAAKTADLNEGLGSLQAALNDLRGDLMEEINSIRENVKALKSLHDSTQERIGGMVDKMDGENQIVERRLGILKSALMTMEDEIFGPSDDLGN